MGRDILGWIGVDFIYRLYYGRLVGVPFRGDAGLNWFNPVSLKQLSFYELAGIMA